MIEPIVNFEFGDIVIVPFPFVARPRTKRRPALVLSDGAFNLENGHCVLAMITTAAQSAWPSDIPIATLHGTGLDHTSKIRWKLFTLPDDLIVRKAGKILSQTRTAVLGTIANYFSGSE